MIKNIVFDFGGVIAPISRDKAVEAFARLGLADADVRLDKYHQTGIFQELEEGKLDTDAFQYELGKLCGRTVGYEETRRAWLGFIVGVNPDILACLEELRKHYRLYLLSNTNPYVAGWACSDRFSPDGRPLDAYFDKLYLSYKVGCTKPDERIFRFMMADAALVPSETLFVDDGPGNIEVGRRLGMHAFCPANGADWREELKNILQSLA